MKLSRLLITSLYAIFLITFLGGTVFAQGTVLPETKYKEVSECELIMNYVNTHIKGSEVEIEFIEGAEEFVGPTQPSEDTGCAGYGLSIKELIARRECIDNVPGMEGAVVTGNDILGCAIMTGDIKIWMIPFYIRFFLEFIIGIAGLVAVGGIIYGGYLYLFAGLTEDKDKGKNAIKNGIIGLILTLTAWGIVNVVIALVTG
ncbi:hypothetical protein GF366_05160 [Candidatus Peregrinibacteria bacterium]|nr:hypothetical protein [Candidatus Peregrinibacteria bacterium]